LLKQSIGGNSYWLMIAWIAPSDRFFEENISTLNYATRASYIANAPTKNIDPKIKEIQDLKRLKETLEVELKTERHLRSLLQ
jgi:kinesin family protein 4/21/27